MATDTYDTGQEEYIKIIETKYAVLALRLSCLQEVVGLMYEKRKLSPKEKEQVSKFLYSRELISANEKLLGIIMTRPIEVYNCFLEALQKTRQTDVYNMLVNENETEEVDSWPINRIRTNFTWLTDNLELESGLLNHLYAEKVLTHSEFGSAPAKSKPEKIDWFLTIIGLKSSDDFETFIRLLRQTDQGHVAEKLSEQMRTPEIQSDNHTSTEKIHVDSNIRKVDKVTMKTSDPRAAGHLWNAMKIASRKANELEDPDDNSHETEISIKVLALQHKAKKISVDVIQKCIGQLLKDMDLTQEECLHAKADYSRLHMELDQSREALRKTKRQSEDLALAASKDDARVKQSYEEMIRDAKLIHVIRTQAARKNNKAVWAVTILDNKLYVASRWRPEVEVFETATFNRIARCIVAGLIDPGDIRASGNGKHLFIMDATYPSKSKMILKVQPNGIGITVAMKWKIGDNEAILSVTEESNVLATVYADHHIIEYTPEGEEVHRIDLSETAMTHPWHAVKLSNGHLLVCHGHYDEPVHGVSKLDKDGKLLGTYSGATSVSNLDVPMNLAVYKSQFYIVADYNNGLVLLMDSELKYKKLLLSKELGIRRPTRLHVDEENGLLIIADNKKGWQDGRVLVFKIQWTD